MRFWWRQKPAPLLSARALRETTARRRRENRHGRPVAEEGRARLLSRIIVGAEPGYGGTSCWQWTGTIQSSGYGVMYYRGRSYMAHRLSYAFFREPVADNLQVDHLCENKLCINPDHLEPVTARTNTLRTARAPASKNAAATHCKRGHEFTPENIYFSKRGSRVCLACNKARCYARRHGLNFEEVVSDRRSREGVAS